jgi:hypothetical protein
VNINHPKGHPLSPRDYQDRLGVVRGVHVRSGEGLFGDLHFNPKHALSEQLIWDAEHAPQNVGMSHNVLARTSLDGGNVVVEAITKVQSIDLVADPATTSGLYEHADAKAIKDNGVEEQKSSGAANDSECVITTPLPHCSTAPLALLTLDDLRLHRPDLVREATLAIEQQLEHVRRSLDERTAQEEASRRRERILQLLQENGLPLPAKDGIASNIVDEQFLHTLMSANDQRCVERLIQERAELVRSASLWSGDKHWNSRAPRSKDQFAQSSGPADSRARNGRDLANAVRVR